MFRLIIVAVLLHVSLTIASFDDIYDDEPLLYMEARTSKYKSPKPLQNKNIFYRMARSHSDESLVDDIDTDFEDFNEEFARPTRSQDKNDNFVRFGRGNSDFVRFGRDPYKYKGQNFLRFGRSATEESVASKKRSRREAGTDELAEEKRNNRDNFLRFGRGGGDDSFVRYGRRLNDISKVGTESPVPTRSRPHFAHGQSEHYPFNVNGRLLYSSPLLNILKKLEEDMRHNN